VAGRFQIKKKSHFVKSLPTSLPLPTDFSRSSQRNAKTAVRRR